MHFHSGCDAKAINFEKSLIKCCNCDFMAILKCQLQCDICIQFVSKLNYPSRQWAVG